MGSFRQSHWLGRASAALLVLAVFSGASWADEAAQTKFAAGLAEGTAWLVKTQAAAQKLNYAGTFIYQQSTQMHASRITHMADATGEHEKLEVLDGKVREFIRTNDEVRCFIPDSKTILIEKRAKSDNFPALLTVAAPEIDAQYKFSKGGIERVAGRNSLVILLEPRDALRYGYRLWTDQETGLLLKAQTVNEKGEVLEQVSFTDIAIGGAIDRNRLKPSATSTEGWHTEKYDSTPANLGALGWTVTAQLPGFRKILEVKRAFGGKREVGQIVLSDGLATLSVFIEPADGANQTEGDASRGPINVVTKRSGDHWLTVVGESPAAVVHMVANSVEFKPVK